LQCSPESTGEKLAFVIGEVMSNPNGSEPYKVIFRQDDKIVCEWQVSSIAEGERQILEKLKGLQEKALTQGDLR
jgi:hypothetical protein